jgi:hypothetical protein
LKWGELETKLALGAAGAASKLSWSDRGTVVASAMQEMRMSLRITLRLFMAFALTVAIGLSPAVAMMPVAGLANAEVDSGYVLVAKKKKKMTRQQEIDKSVESRTVPSRYRSSVPKQYHQYIPFAK